MAMKRKRVYGGPSVYKRRRTGGRKSAFFKRRARPSATLTGQSSRGLSFGYKHKRLNIRRYKNTLYRGTDYKTHYRSAQDLQFVATTNVATDSANGYLIRGTRINFWTAAGGAYPSNVGGSVPVFDSDIIVRGGYLRLALVNENVTETVRARVFLMKANKFPNNTVITSGTMANIPTTWDPSIFAGWREFGKVVLTREMIMPPSGVPFEVFYRLPIIKYDQDDYVTNGGYCYWWIACVSKMSAITALVANVRITYSFNLTFCGDAQ